MTRTIQCDVCGESKEISNADDYFVLQIPHRNLEEEIDEPLVVDVCTLQCLSTVVESLQPDAPQTQTLPAEPEPVHNGRLQPQAHVGRYEGEVTVR
jgi:hypothetical protein